MFGVFFFINWGFLKEFFVVIIDSCCFLRCIEGIEGKKRYILMNFENFYNDRVFVFCFIIIKNIILVILVFLKLVLI